ncbi:MAG: DsbA family protein, partial [Polyangiaceae bacterium]
MAAPPEDDAGVPVTADDPVWGERAAPVTVVEFADFQCPFCARAEPTLTRIRDAYGPDKVRIVWKSYPMPFHANARPAAEAAAGVRALAGNDAFWHFLGLAFADQSDLGEDKYVAWAEQSGVTQASVFESGLRSHTWASKVDADVAEAKNVGVQGTPWFFINGVRVVGAQPFEAFQALIDAQLAAAKAKVASGTPPARVYAMLSKENRAAQPPDHDNDDDAKEDDKTVYKIPLGESPARGGATPLVTIVEFADYQCPYCARVEPTLRELATNYGDKLRFVFRNEPLPFHPRAEPAAEAALEVRAARGDTAFWAMHDALFDGADPRDLSDDSLVLMAGRLNVPPGRVKMAIEKHTHRAEIDADEDAADDFQANGTPHFFINGHRLVGAQPKEAFSAIIDEEIKKAQALLDEGVKPSDLYATLTKDGAAPAEPARVDLKPLPARDPSRGPATARVAIHEFADFECPYCAHAEATLKEIAQAYGDKVRFVWHDLPLAFHKDALPASRAGREAQR